MATAILVEDDASVRLMLESTLRLAGHDVLAAVECAGDALLHFQAGKVPDIVFLDMILPGGLGSEIIGYLRQHHAGVKIFMVTGLTERQVLTLVPSSGYDAIAYKPFSVPQFLGQVKSLLPELPQN